jgi:hypothetical protein
MEFVGDGSVIIPARGGHDKTSSRFKVEEMRGTLLLNLEP